MACVVTDEYGNFQRSPANGFDATAAGLFPACRISYRSEKHVHIDRQTIIDKQRETGTAEDSWISAYGGRGDTWARRINGCDATRYRNADFRFQIPFESAVPKQGSLSGK